jgi:hypothetical protein
MGFSVDQLGTIVAGFTILNQFYKLSPTTGIAVVSVILMIRK